MLLQFFLYRLFRVLAASKYLYLCLAIILWALCDCAKLTGQIAGLGNNDCSSEVVFCFPANRRKMRRKITWRCCKSSQWQCNSKMAPSSGPCLPVFFSLFPCRCVCVLWQAAGVCVLWQAAADRHGFSPHCNFCLCASQRMVARKEEDVSWCQRSVVRLIFKFT